MIWKDNSETRKRATELVASGRVVAFRTDTFYGLGADPFNPDGVRAINELKGRSGKPILIIISDMAQIERFVANRPPLFEALCANHWPGALTIVAAAKPEISDELTARTGTIGIRLPDDAAVREFVGVCGGALTATSANLAGEPPARTALEVARSFPEGLTMIVDGGDAPGGQPSTVIAVSGSTARLIREGVVTRLALQKTLQSIGAELEV